MSTFPSPRPDTLKALCGVRSEDIFMLREAICDIRDRVTEATSLCGGKAVNPETGRSEFKWFFPKHSAFLHFLLDELDVFIDEDEEGGAV